MNKLVIKPRAEDDLEKIWRYSYSNWGKQQADSYIDSLSAVFQLLCAHPDMGSVYEEIQPNVRVHHHQQHLIVYQHQANTILIARVLHERMNMWRYT